MNKVRAIKEDSLASTSGLYVRVHTVRVLLHTHAPAHTCKNICILYCSKVTYTWGK